MNYTEKLEAEVRKAFQIPESFVYVEEWENGDLVFRFGQEMIVVSDLGIATYQTEEKTEMWSPTPPWGWK